MVKWLALKLIISFKKQIDDLKAKLRQSGLNVI